MNVFGSHCDRPTRRPHLPIRPVLELVGLWRYRDRSIAMLISSHQLNELQELCGQFLFIKGGRLSDEFAGEQKRITVIELGRPLGVAKRAAVAALDPAAVIHTDSAGREPVQLRFHESQRKDRFGECAGFPRWRVRRTEHADAATRFSTGSTRARTTPCTSM